MTLENKLKQIENELTNAQKELENVTKRLEEKEKTLTTVRPCSCVLAVLIPYYSPLTTHRQSRTWRP